jgi:hypothetical protein
MWNLWPQEKNNVCQLSNSKGSCMEEEDVFGEKGCHMFEKKVSDTEIRVGMASIHTDYIGLASRDFY